MSEVSKKEKCISPKLAIIDSIFEKVENISELLLDAENEALVAKLECFSEESLTGILDMLNLTTKFLKNK